MTTKIYIPSEDVWEIAMDNKERLKGEELIIAKSEIAEVRITWSDFNNLPYVEVISAVDNKEIDGIVLHKKENSAGIIEDLYDAYLYPADETIEDFEDEDETENLVNEIYPYVCETINIVSGLSQLVSIDAEEYWDADTIEEIARQFISIIKDDYEMDKEIALVMGESYYQN